MFTYFRPQSRYDLHTLRLKLGILYIVGSLGNCFEAGASRLGQGFNGGLPIPLSGTEGSASTPNGFWLFLEAQQEV